MKFTRLGFFLMILIFGIFTSCNTAENNKANIEKTKPIDWKTELQKATSFKEETQLLQALFQQDSSNTHQQLIANRLQTFDLRHLKDTEKLTVLKLYELSLQPKRQPSNNILQIAYAKLNAVYPTNNPLVNEKIKEILSLIKESTDMELE
ncbi:MAG: hypothetical protein AB8G86_20190 [Saprospiraceae bacterium]